MTQEENTIDDVDNQPQAEVLVIGEALIDIVETEDGVSEHVGGSPANVALGLGRRATHVELLTQLGDDDRGRRIAQHLEASGVRLRPESAGAPRTSTARARIAADGQAEYEFDVSWNPSRPENVSAVVVHVGSVAAFLEPGATVVRDIITMSGAREVTFDPNIRTALIGSHEHALASFEATAKLATVVKMSDEDAAWLYPGASPDEVLDTVLQLGPGLAAITLGAQGAILVNTENRVWVPAVPVVAVDTIGAGDTFMSSLVRAVLDGGSMDVDRRTLERIGRDAVAAAAITVSRPGADLPWAEELAS